MTLAEFGEWLSGVVNAAQDPKLKPVEPYSRQRVSQWELGNTPVPAKIEAIVLRRQLELRDEQIAKLTQKDKPRPKQKPRG